MPTPWKRSPEELHRTYIANTEAFYKIAGRGLSQELDDFMAATAIGLWKNSRNLGQQNVDFINQLYSKGRPQPHWLLWELTDQVCKSGDFLPPLFFWNLTESDARRGASNSRVFIRMLTNILLYLAAADDEVTMAEAEYITECSEKLSAICDGAGVMKSKAPLNPNEYVTSVEPAFTARAGVASDGKETENKAASAEAEAEKPDLDELMAKLDELVGLKTVKREVKSLMNLIKVRKLREEAGLPNTAMSLHMVFLGNPGTGKTTVARLMAGLYAAIGALSKGQLVEVDRSGLVAGYVGQTALKTQEVIQSAMGGVLFIDEAYSLANGGENDFGREAVETILKAMEDHRDDLVVIVAGYDEPMEKFINSNPGLQSRFNKYMYFPDYNGAELMDMFRINCKKNGYAMDAEAEEYAVAFFNDLYVNRDDNFGNGRDVRNRFEDVVSRQANRLAAMESPTKDDLMTITKADFMVPPEEEDVPAETEKTAGEEPPAAAEKEG